MDEESKKSNLKANAQFKRVMPMGRLIGNGIDHIDYARLIQAVDEGENWIEVCERLGDEAADMAEKNMPNGNKLTARTFYLNATALYRIGQYTIVPDIPKKIDMYRKLIDCYGKAAKLFDPPIEKVEIPFRGNRMTGWLRLPKGANNDCPAVVSVGGADGWREEHQNYSNFFVERGLAYLMIDGPGQGETRLFNKAYMPIDVEKAFTAAIDYLYDDDRVGKNIGIAGWSFGGYLVARTATFSKNLKACCVVGGSYDPTEIFNNLPHFIHVFQALLGKDEAETRKMLAYFNLKGICKNISCPLMIIHGKPDFIFSADSVQKIYDEASSVDKQIKIWDDGEHCVTNHLTEVICLISDWFADRLKL